MKVRKIVQTMAITLTMVVVSTAWACSPSTPNASGYPLDSITDIRTINVSVPYELNPIERDAPTGVTIPDDALPEYLAGVEIELLSRARQCENRGEPRFVRANHPNAVEVTLHDGCGAVDVDRHDPSSDVVYFTRSIEHSAVGHVGDAAALAGTTEEASADTDDDVFTTAINEGGSGRYGSISWSKPAGERGSSIGWQCETINGQSKSYYITEDGLEGPKTTCFWGCNSSNKCATSPHTGESAPQAPSGERGESGDSGDNNPYDQVDKPNLPSGERGDPWGYVGTDSHCPTGEPSGSSGEHSGSSTGDDDSQHSCSSGWRCEGEFRYFKYSDCTTGSWQSCEHGCSAGRCALRDPG